MPSSPKSPRRRLCGRTPSSSSVIASPPVAGPSSQTSPPRCSIRECFKALCRPKAARTSQPTSPGTPVDNLPPLPDSPSDSGSRPSFSQQSRATLAGELEDKEPIIILEEATPRLNPVTSQTVDEDYSQLVASPSSLTMASPSPRSEATTLVAAQTALSPGRIRRRDSDDSGSAASSSRSPRSISRLSPGPDSAFAYASTHLGEAPIPFRTSFLPRPADGPPGLSDRPAVLPHLTRYTAQTEVTPADLPIYQHYYRQVRRRMEVSSTSNTSDSASVGATVSPSHGGDVPAPLPRRTRTRQHTAGLRRDRERTGEGEGTMERRADIANSPSGTSGPETLPVNAPPTPPPMFMASHGHSQFPPTSAPTEAGEATIPQIVPHSTPSLPSHSTPTGHSIGTNMNSSASRHDRLSHLSTAHRHWATQAFEPTADFTVVPAHLVAGSHQGQAAVSSVHARQTPMTTIPPPLPPQHYSRQPALFDWESPMYSHALGSSQAPQGHIASMGDPSFEQRRLVLNQFAYFHDQQALARLAHQSYPTPAASTAEMPTRTESLYSRLARLDSLRSENPVYRGEIPRPYLPVNESAGSSSGSSRRSNHPTSSRTGSLAPYDAQATVLPPIPPYVHDSTYRSTPSPWSPSSSGGSRWRSMGALSAVAGDLGRPTPTSHPDEPREDVLAWFNNSFPYDDVPIPTATEPEGDVANEAATAWNDYIGADPNSGAWDLLPHFPIDTLDTGFHDPMHPTALNHIHPFARSRDTEHGPSPVRSHSAPDTSRLHLPEGPPPPLFESFRLDQPGYRADLPENSDSNLWAGGQRLPANMFPIASHIEPPPPLVHSAAPAGAAAYVMASGAGAQDADDFTPPIHSWRQSSAYAQTHAQVHQHHQRMGRYAPLHSQIPTMSPRILSPAFLRHYRIDKNWPVERQKQVIKVVLRLLNGFSPVLKKLEAQSVLKYVTWDEVDTVCAARGMEKETVCAVCYDDVSRSPRHGSFKS